MDDCDRIWAAVADDAHYLGYELRLPLFGLDLLMWIDIVLTAPQIPVRIKRLTQLSSDLAPVS